MSNESDRLALLEEGLDNQEPVGLLKFYIIYRDSVWKGGYRSWKSYCEERWGMGRDYGYLKAQAGQVISILAPRLLDVVETAQKLTVQQVLPDSEGVARPLKALVDTPELLKDAWDICCAVAARNGRRQPHKVEVEEVVSAYGVRPVMERVHNQDAADNAAHRDTVFMLGVDRLMRKLRYRESEITKMLDRTSTHLEQESEVTSCIHDQQIVQAPGESKSCEHPTPVIAGDCVRDGNGGVVDLRLGPRTYQRLEELATSTGRTTLDFLEYLVWYRFSAYSRETPRAKLLKDFDLWFEADGSPIAEPSVSMDGP